MFAINIKKSEDVSDKYHVFRSFRRESESRAVAMNVSPSDRYAVDRWRQKEWAGASRWVNHTIDQYYKDVVLAPDSFLRYTKAKNMQAGSCCSRSHGPVSKGFLAVFVRRRSGSQSGV